MFSVEIDDRTRLRLWRDADAEALHAVIEANRAMLAPWMPWAAGQTLSQTRAFLAEADRQWAAGSAVETAILRDDVIVGAAGLNRIELANRSANVGYWLAADAQGRGLVTRAAGALLDHAFTELDLHRIELRAAPDNRRSRAVAERLGFTREGIARGAERVGDHWLDHVVHSMLADEWTTRRAGRPR